MKILHPKVKTYYFTNNEATMEQEVLCGLAKPQKQIPAKYFYDLKGSKLFEQITEQAEYYPTRAEMNIFLNEHQSITACAGPVHTLIEYGSGSSKKIKSLLSSFTALKEYVPIDISHEFLLQSCIELSGVYPHLTVKAVCGDYTSPIKLPIENEGKKVIFFPGSTIGNFEPEEAEAFFQQSAGLLACGDGFLIGVDIKKSRETLERAYNDQNGITAQFNLNVLSRINRELGADFVESQFEHTAFYNEEKGRIEMHLRSKTIQSVRVSNQKFDFQPGETIHTENSYKYSIQEFQQLARKTGFAPVSVWTDENNDFSVHYFEKTPHV